jgi:ATP-dependent Clp protease ATP-binding subunit ClpX
LTKRSLKLILTQPKNALLTQYQRLFEMQSINLVVADEALTAIAHKAIKEGTGAWGLRTVMENILLDTMFHSPALKSLVEVRISLEVVEGVSAPIYIFPNANATNPPH